MRRFLLRCLHALWPSIGEREVEREIASHLVLLADEFRRRGLSAADASAAARRALGSTSLTMDRHRDARSFVWIDDLRRDVAYATRLLRRNPAFALTAALSLAIGIGADTTIFTIADALLFRPPAGVAHPDRLVDIGRRVRRGGAFNPGSYPDYLDLRARTVMLDGVYAASIFPVATSVAIDASLPERVFATRVSINYFDVLGVTPAAGRLFGAGDSERPGASPIAVLSPAYWALRFNRDPSAIGRSIRVDGQPFTIVGVASQGFQGTGVRSSDMWIPLAMTASARGSSILTNRAAATIAIGGRLKAGVDIGAAAAEADAIGAALAREYPLEDGDKGLRLLPMSPVAGAGGPIAVFLALLAGIASTVLVVAGANVAGVLLARAAARRREIAVRLAIGAGRGRLVRQLMSETLLLFAIGGAGGLILARMMTSLAVAVLPALPFPIEVSLALDARAVAFTAVLSLVAAVSCGLAPALQASKIGGVAGLREDDAGPMAKSRLRHAFLVAQLAFGIVLVVLAGLFVRALERVQSRNPGFDPSSVEIAALDLSTAGYSDSTAPVFAREILACVRQLPNVESATIASALPSGFERMSLAALRPPGDPAQPLWAADWNVVEPGYFSTLRMALLSGRDFTEADRAGGQRVAIIGAGAARRFFADKEAIGHYVFQQRHTPPSAPRAEAEPLLVVGVVADPTYGTLLDGSTGLYIYVPLQQRYVAGFANIVVRSADGRSTANEVRALVRSMDPNVPVGSAKAAGDVTSLGLLPRRVAASTAGSLGLVAVLLAALGLYGVTAYSVARRTREIGVRVALGATRGRILGMVIGEGLALTAAGSAAGLILAAGAAELASSLLFGVNPADPPIFAGAVLLFVVVALAACCPPALRATRINPVDALRNE